MEHKPLIIYLDTQDYINLFNEADGGPNHSVLRKILDFRERGEILIGFSIVTILEFITKPTDQYRQERVRRGRLVKDICGRHAFPSPLDLAKGAHFPNDGMFLFDARKSPIVSAKWCRNQIIKATKEFISKRPELNRAERRKMCRAKNLPNLIEKIISSCEKGRENLFSIPISTEFLDSDIISRFYTGKCSDQEFEERINAWMSDPEEFSRIFYDYGQQSNAIEKIFGNTLDDFENLTLTLQSLAEELESLNNAIVDQRRAIVELGFDKRFARNLMKQIKPPELDRNSINTQLEKMVGEIRAKHFHHYIEKVYISKQRVKRSDIMDLLQMCYTYDCDLFRCDKDMANIFSSYGPFENKLVRKFADLPAKIEEAIANRR